MIEPLFKVGDTVQELLKYTQFVVERVEWIQACSMYAYSYTQDDAGVWYTEKNLVLIRRG